MQKYLIAVACFAAVSACQADGRYPSSDAGARERAAPAASERGRSDVPTGAPATSTEGGSTAGPHEGTRASTPPGTSRDGQPPVGGAIVDPTGAVTGTPPAPAR